MNRLTLHLPKVIVTFLAFVILTACDDRGYMGNYPVDYTKEKREMLGDMIESSIKSDPDVAILENTYPYSIAYEHIQKLYNQVTNEIRLDARSPKANKWDWNRAWKVFIVNEPAEKFAYIIPGGHVFLSTGLLQSLEKDYELYYILAFEASLLDERYLLNKLFQEFRIDRLDDYLKGFSESDNLTFNEMAAQMKWLQYDESTTESVDIAAFNRICKSSLYSRFGIIPILGKLENADQWLNTRPSYDSRNDASYMENLEFEAVEDCGNFITGCKYKDRVLANLPE